MVQQIEKYFRHCLWRGSDIKNRKPPLAGWALPKSQGGLGIKKIVVQNDALLMKQLHKFYNHADVPWVHLVWDNYYTNSLPGQRKRGSFWWRDILKLLGQFKGIALPIPQNRRTISLWDDLWAGQVFKHASPELKLLSVVKHHPPIHFE